MKTQNTFPAIKSLVFELIHASQGRINNDRVEQEVLNYFPKSRWSKSHWSWYRNQIKNGKYANEFSEIEKKNLFDQIVLKNATGKIQRQQPKTDHDNKIKRIGDSLLNHVRTMMKDVADTDEVLYFKLNRWIYSRLLQDEISKKRPIKKALWDSGMRSCQKCGKQFESIKGVEIHRINNAEIYSVKNCILLCRPCHQQ
jgi:hypothetical protein